MDTTVIIDRSVDLRPAEPAADAKKHLFHTDVIMPAWNNLKWTKQAVESFITRTDYEKTPYHLILLDNGSVDGTGIYFEELRKMYPERVKIIRNEVNNGWVDAVNQGVAAMCPVATYFCCVNNDVVFTQDNWLGRMIDGMKDKFHIAAGGPTSNKAGWRQNVIYNNPKIESEEVPFLVGFCMVFKRYAVDALVRQDGYFMDTLFSPGGCDEVDVCIRLADLGFRFFIDRRIYVHHYCSKSLELVTDNLEEFHADKVRKLEGKWGVPRVDYFMGRQLTRVLIGIPTYGQMHHKAVMSLVTLEKPEGVAVEIIARNLPDVGRNILAHVALDWGYDFIFYLDDDMVIEQTDLLMKFLATMKANPSIDVLSPIAYMRNPPFHPCVFYKSDDPPYYNLATKRNAGFQDVDATTCAATLVRASVFRRMKKPWFEWLQAPGGERIGEDVSFCKKVKDEIGGRVVVDTDSEIWHIGDNLMIGHRTFDKYNTEKAIVKEVLKF